MRKKNDPKFTADKGFVRQGEYWKCYRCEMVGNTEAESCPECEKRAYMEAEKIVDQGFEDAREQIREEKVITLKELTTILEGLRMEKIGKQLTRSDIHAYNEAVEKNNQKIEAVKREYGLEGEE